MNKFPGSWKHGFASSSSVENDGSASADGGKVLGKTGNHEESCDEDSFIMPDGAERSFANRSSADEHETEERNVHVAGDRKGNCLTAS